MLETVPSTKIGQMYKDHIEMILKKDIEAANSFASTLMVS